MIACLSTLNLHRKAQALFSYGFSEATANAAGPQCVSAKVNNCTSVQLVKSTHMPDHVSRLQHAAAIGCQIIACITRTWPYHKQPTSDLEESLTASDGAGTCQFPLAEAFQRLIVHPVTVNHVRHQRSAR
jgi:hypothetical protein